MSFARSSLPCLIALALLASCAKEKAPSSTLASAEAYILPAENLSEAALIARAAKITCAPGATCSPSVGLLSFALQNGAAQCTASLVAPDIVATNAHCVPDDIQKAGASCRGRIWMNFLKNENPNFETQIECDRVIVASGAGSKESADYAFLRLRRASARPTFRISRQGFKDAEYVKIEKVDPIKGETMSGLQHEVTCQAAQHTLIADFNDDLAEVPLMADCEVMKGNSGSALRALDGSVRGVIFGVLDTAPLGSIFAEKGMRIGGAMGPMGVGSNFACLNLPAGLGAGAPNAGCAAPRAKNKSETVMNKAYNDELDKFVQANQASAPGFRWFDYDVSRPTNPEIILRPKCVYQSLVQLNREVSAGDLSFVADVKLDEYARYSSMTLAKREKAPAKAKVSGQANGSFLVKLNAETLTLSACPKP
jgi:V8-like Glu-specific endopeptidase